MASRGRSGEFSPPSGCWARPTSGSERRRLIEIPPNWEQLADDRLDLLRRMAEPVKSWAPLSPPGGVPVVGEGTEGDGER